MKLHHTAYKKNYINYILKVTQSTPAELFQRFYDEYGWAIERKGKYAALTDWLRGLAIDIPYTNDEVVDLAVEMGSIDENPSDKARAKVIENYFPFMANIILGMEA